MKLFAIQAWGNYGGGVAIVCAESKEEAIAFASKIRDRTWNTDYARPQDVVELAPTATGVLYNFETGE